MPVNWGNLIGGISLVGLALSGSGYSVVTSNAAKDDATVAMKDADTAIVVALEARQALTMAQQNDADIDYIRQRIDQIADSVGAPPPPESEPEPEPEPPPAPAEPNLEPE